MKYYLPNVYGDIRSDKNGFTQLAKLKETLNNSIDDEFIVDFSKCGFFEANMAAPLKAVLSTADKQKVIAIEAISSGIERILRKNLFLTEYGYPPACDSYATALPYRCFQTSDRKTFDDYLYIHLSGKNIPKMSQELRKKFRQSIFEIFANCAMHSNSILGIFICGQFYPRLNRLDLTISDAGVGIPSNVRRFKQNNEISSVDAIRWAIEEGNTTKTGNQPGGLGLALLHSFIKQNQGKIQIISRQGYYEFVGGVPKFEKLDLDFLGTTINLEIKTDDNKSYCLRSEVHSKENIF